MTASLQGHDYSALPVLACCHAISYPYSTSYVPPALFSWKHGSKFFQFWLNTANAPIVHYLCRRDISLHNYTTVPTTSHYYTLHEFRHSIILTVYIMVFLYYVSFLLMSPGQSPFLSIPMCIDRLKLTLFFFSPLSLPPAGDQFLSTLGTLRT